MDLHFLGGATTVTGSQDLLGTRRAPLLIRCPVFPGGPDDARPARPPDATPESAALAAATPRPPATREAGLGAEPPEMHPVPDEPLYTADDAAAAIEHFDAIRYDEEREVAPGVHATYLDAGHILGSAIIRLRIEAGDPAKGGPAHETTIVFSRGPGRPGTPIIRAPTVPTPAAYVPCES